MAFSRIIHFPSQTIALYMLENIKLKWIIFQKILVNLPSMYLFLVTLSKEDDTESNTLFLTTAAKGKVF